MTQSKKSQKEPEKPSVRPKTSKLLIRFLATFALCYILFEIAYFNSWMYQHVFQKINEAFASGAASVLSIIGIPAKASGVTIANDTFSISVMPGCDSIEALAIFIFGVLTFPSAWSFKLKGLVVGSLIMLSLNLVRLVNLFWIGLNHRDLFDLFHLEIWQAFFIVLSIVLWLVWVMKAVKPSKISA